MEAMKFEVASDVSPGTSESQGFISRSIHDDWMKCKEGPGGGGNLYNRDMNVNPRNRKLDKISWKLGSEYSKEEVWINNLKPEKPEEPITREEALAWVTKHADSEIFIERNCSSLKTEDQIHRIAMIKEYIKENLK